MNGMAVVGVGFEPVRVVVRVFESVVDAINLEPDTETIEALVDAFGNGRGENGIVVFQSREAPMAGCCSGVFDVNGVAAAKAPSVGSDLRYPFFKWYMRYPK